MRHPRYSFFVTLLSITRQDKPAIPGYLIKLRLDEETILSVFVSDDQLSADFASSVIPNVVEGDVLELSLAIPVRPQ